MRAHSPLSLWTTTVLLALIAPAIGWPLFDQSAVAQSVIVWKEAERSLNKAMQQRLPSNQPQAALSRIASAHTETSRQEQGSLQPGDSTVEDGSLYDEYSFEGQAGQSVLINLKSTQFNTYLLLVNPAGETIAESDDIAANNSDSRLAVTLPTNGVYRVFANAHDKQGQGQYNLTIQTVAADAPEFLAAQANQLLQQGRGQRERRQFQAALELINQALKLYQQLGNRAGEGNALYASGDVYYDQSRYPQAIEFYQKALMICREIKDRLNEAITLNKLGLSHANLGQYPQALDYYQQTLVIAKDIGNRSGEGTTLNNIGNIYTSLGQYPQALDYFQQALVIAKDIGDRRGEEQSLNSIGLIYISLGQYPQALEALHNGGMS